MDKVTVRVPWRAGARAFSGAQIDAWLRGRAVTPAFVPLALTLFLPPPWLLVGYLLLPGYYLVRWRTRGAFVPATAANPPILLLLLGVVAGLLVSSAQLAGVVSAGKLLAGITTFYVLLDILETPRELWLATGALVAVGLGVVLLLPFGVSWSLDKVYTLPAFLDWTLRPPGQGTNANVVAGVLVLVFPLALALLWAPRAGLRWLGAATLGPLIVALLVLQARNAWFALLGGLLVASAFYRRWLLPLIPLVLLGALGINQQFGGTWLNDIIFGKVGTVTGGTLIERQALWSQAIELIRLNPLTGIGMGAYQSVAPYAPPYSPQSPGLAAPHAHNLFLQVLLDAGLAGFVGLTGVLVLAMIAAGRANARQVAAPLPMGVLAAIAVVVLHGIGDSIFWGFKGGWAVWVVFGIAFALDAIHQRHE